MGGSRMFVEAGTTVPVEALIHGIIVAVRQRRLRGGGRGPRRQRGDLRRADDRARPRARHDRLDLPQRLRLARGRPRHERPRPRDPVAPHHRRLPRVLRLLPGDRVHLERHHPAEPQPAAEARHRRRRAEDRAHRRGRLRPRRLGGAERAAHDLHGRRARERGRARRGDRGDREVGVRRLRHRQASSTPAPRSPGPRSGSARRPRWRWSRRPTCRCWSRARSAAASRRGCVYHGADRGADRRGPEARRARGRGARPRRRCSSTSSPPPTCRAAG